MFKEYLFSHKKEFIFSLLILISIYAGFNLGGLVAIGLANTIELQTGKNSLNHTSPLNNLETRMGRMLNLTDDLPLTFSENLGPHLEIITKRDNDFIYLEIPQSNKDATVDIEVKNGMIKISSQIKNSSESKSENSTSYSWKSSTSTRLINLPKNANPKEYTKNIVNNRIFLKFKRL